MEERPIYIVMVMHQRACQRIFDDRDEALEYANKIALQQKEKTYVMRSVAAVELKVETKYIYDL